MKRIFALVLVLVLCLPFLGCSSSLAEENATAEETKTEAPKETEKKDEGPITYPKGFSVGYSIGDITTTPLPMYEAVAQTAHDRLNMTCVAICDGENVGLIMSADLKGMNKTVFDRSTKIIADKFDIPAENVIISCTHTHSAPTVGGNSAELTRWAAYYYKQLPIIVEEALRDLTLAEAYIGSSQAESISFVRRYILSDGSHMTNPNESKLAGRTVVAHENDADTELRTIRFEREGKKDVLMVNYQTHYGGATSVYPEQLSADFVTPFRQQAEKKYDCLFAYQSGAGGNVNFNSAIPGEKIYPTFLDAIPAFIEATDKALEVEEKAEVGPVRCAAGVSTVQVQKDSAERLKQADEIASASEEMKPSLIKKYGFYSKHEATAVRSRNRDYPDTFDIPLSCITCGDLAFTAFPYEMFDQNGVQIREASPYKMTFVNSLAGGSFGYIPTIEAFPYGSYEVVVCRFVPGCGEQFVAKMEELLNTCNNAG